MPGYVNCYMGAGPNSYYNAVVKMAECHIDTLPIFQDIIDASGTKGKYGGWMSVLMKKCEHPVICMGQYEDFLNNIFSQIRFGNTMESIVSF